MAGMDGLAYLMTLLGGGAKGGYEGFSAGIEDQQKAANLAEKKREFDEGYFTDVTPEDAARLGIPAGRRRNTIIPSLLTSGEKDKARAEAQRKAAEGGAAYTEAAKLFPETGVRQPGEALDLSQNPEAAGTMPPEQDNRALRAMGMLEKAGIGGEKQGAFIQWLRGQQAANKPGASEFFAPHYTTDEQGNTKITWAPKSGGPTVTNDIGIKQPRSRGQTWLAAHDYATNSMGLVPGSKEYSDFMMQAVPTPQIIPQDAGARTRIDLLGDKGIPQPGQTPPPQQGPSSQGQPVMYSEFFREMKKTGMDDATINQKWAELNSKTPTSVIGPKPGTTTPASQPQPSAQTQPQDQFPETRKGLEPEFKGYSGKYEVYNPPPPQVPPGMMGYRPARPPAQEVDKLRDQEFAVNSMRTIADTIDKMGMDDRQRLAVALKTGLPDALAKVPAIGGLLSRASQSSGKLALAPEAAAINTHIGHAQLRYENAMAGVRGASSTTLYPVFQAIMGNLGDINTPTKLRQLANDLQQAALIGQRDMAAARYQGIPLHFRPEGGGDVTPEMTPFQKWQQQQGGR